MEITLGYATKLLDNIMVNYSQWHTERSTNKKVHAIEEINVLSGKMDELMKLFATKSVTSDPNDMPLSTFIDNNNESMDVNFFGRNNFGNNTYRGNFNPKPYPSNPSNNYGNSVRTLTRCHIDLVGNTSYHFAASRTVFPRVSPYLCPGPFAPFGTRI